MKLKAEIGQKHTFRHIKNISTLKVFFAEMLSAVKFSRGKKREIFGKQDRSFTYTPLGISHPKDQ